MLRANLLGGGGPLWMIASHGVRAARQGVWTARGASVRCGPAGVLGEPSGERQRSRSPEREATSDDPPRPAGPGRRGEAETRERGR